MKQKILALLLALTLLLALPACGQKQEAPEAEAPAVTEPVQPEEPQEEAPAEEETPTEEEAPAEVPEDAGSQEDAQKPAEKPAEKIVQPKPAQPRQPRQEKPRQERPQPEKRPEAAAPAAPQVDLPECDDDNAKRIIAFVSGLLEHMDSAAQVKVYEVEKGRYKVLLVGEKLGQLIGHRGETLDAIQQLTNYAVNTGADKRIRVQMAAENYRAKREQSLESLARKVADKVQKYRRSVTLEPMNAYERHVIHATLQDVKGVTTYSVGTEPNRRVVVAYDRGEAR